MRRDVATGLVFDPATVHRCVFLLDATAPKFSATHPFYAAQMRLGLAVNVLQHGTWGNLYLRQRKVADLAQPGRTLHVNGYVGILGRTSQCEIQGKAPTGWIFGLLRISLTTHTCIILPDCLSCRTSTSSSWA